MKDFYLDIGKTYSDILNKYQVDLFSFDIFNNWLFFFIGFSFLLLGVILFSLSEVFEKKLKSDHKELKKEYENSKFLSLSYSNLKELKFNSENFLGKNESVNDDYLSYIKVKSFKKSELFLGYCNNILAFILCGLGLIFLAYSTAFLWIYESSKIKSNFESFYSEKIADLEVLEIDSEILKMEPIILTKEYLESEIGENYKENVIISNNSYVYYESNKSLPGYKIIIKTDGKIEHMFVYEKDINIHSLENTNKKIPFVSYNNFGNLDDLSKKYNIKELEDLNSYDFVLSGVKNINIYIPDDNLNKYINKEKIVIE